MKRQERFAAPVCIKNSAHEVSEDNSNILAAAHVQCRARMLANRLLDRGCSSKVSMKKKRKVIQGGKDRVYILVSESRVAAVIG